MSKDLPTGGFKWIDPQELNLIKYTSNSLKGCVLEFDVEYPKWLRQLHNDYSLAPDNIEVKENMSSSYQVEVMLKNWCPTFSTKKTTWLIIKTCNFI